jgi:CxxC motif-containing protein
MERIELTCIGCPMGCLVTVERDGDTIVNVSGHTCPRGDIYARKEVTAPTRIVTSTVKVTGGARERVACKTASDIPKDKIMDVMAAINAASVPAPVQIGDILIPDAASTGVPIIATANVG